MDTGRSGGVGDGCPSTDSPGVFLTPNVATLSCLSDQVRDGIRRHIGEEPIVYADIPVHLNVGDLLINLAAEALFADCGIPIRDRISLGNPRRLTRRHGGRNPPIVLHGGGNFGDLYPHHEVFRQQVLERFPDSPVVLLPQTVHYKDPERLPHDMALWSTHRDLVFMVRDEPSLALVRPFLGERAVRLPDMAHYLIRQPAFLKPERSVSDLTTLMMARRDIERTGRPRARPDTAPFDWDDLYGPADLVNFALTARLIRLDQFVALPFDPVTAWYAVRDRLIQKAVNRFGMADEVTTDRLHGMLLALMMRLPVRMHDNSYGKLGNYIDSWSLGPSRQDAPLCREGEQTEGHLHTLRHRLPSPPHIFRPTGPLGEPSA